MASSLTHLSRIALAVVAVFASFMLTAVPSSAAEHHVFVRNTTDRGVWVTVYRQICANGTKCGEKDGAYCAPPGKTVNSGHDVNLFSVMFEIKYGPSCNGANETTTGERFDHKGQPKKSIEFTVFARVHHGKPGYDVSTKAM